MEADQRLRRSPQINEGPGYSVRRLVQGLLLHPHAVRRATLAKKTSYRAKKAQTGEPKNPPGADILGGGDRQGMRCFRGGKTKAKAGRTKLSTARGIGKSSNGLRSRKRPWGQVRVVLGNQERKTQMQENQKRRKENPHLVWSFRRCRRSCSWSS